MIVHRFRSAHTFEYKNFRMTSKSRTNNHYHILILGGGTAGITVAAQLRRKLKTYDLAIIEPLTKHYYQPLWTRMAKQKWLEVLQSKRPYYGLDLCLPQFQQPSQRELECRFQCECQVAHGHGVFPEHLDGDSHSRSRFQNREGSVSIKHPCEFVRLFEKGFLLLLPSSSCCGT